MNEIKQTSPLSRPWYKKTKYIVIAIIIIVGAITLSQISSGQKQTNTPATEKKKTVSSVLLSEGQFDASTIETVGSIKAEAQVDVVATTKGTVRSLYFDVGDKVTSKRILAYLYDSANLTNLNNARTNLINTKSNQDATKRLTTESIHQAELGVQAAEETVEAAEIGLDTAVTNLNNARALKEKGGEDTKANAIISYASFLNTIDSSLDQINSIIDAEDNAKLQIVGIASTLGAKDVSSVNIARTDYRAAKEQYLQLNNSEPNSDSITSDMQAMLTGISLLTSAVDSTIYVLDNTVSSVNFPASSLEAQKSAFSALKDKIVGTQTSAKNTLNSLENIKLLYNQDIDGLESAVTAAENRLTSAQTGLTNALVSLDNAKEASNQQILNSGSAVDNAQGQLNLAQTQAADLTIKAPISGIITQKNIELGAEVNPGQVLAEISQTDNMKIEINLASADIYRIEIGQEVELGDDQLKGKINSIDPAADPITKKVKVEILFDNKNKELIQGTFIKVKIKVKALEKSSPSSLYIPLRAVTITQNESYVFIANGELAKKVDVVTGKAENALIEITNGLSLGDELIVDGNKNLEDGNLIEIIK